MLVVLILVDTILVIELSTITEERINSFHIYGFSLIAVTDPFPITLPPNPVTLYSVPLCIVTEYLNIVIKYC